MTNYYNVNLRGPDFREIETLNGYNRLQFTTIFLDRGSWSISLPIKHPTAQVILDAYAAETLPDYGIVIRPVGSTVVLLSGFIEELYVTEGGDAGPYGATLTMTGISDDQLLATEQAYIDPTIDVSSTVFTGYTSTHDIRTGPAETVLLGYIAANIGPAAGIVRRRYSFLDVPASLGRGSTLTWRARFDNLLEQSQSIATIGGIGFRLAQTNNNKVGVEIWIPAVRDEAMFSVRNGTVSRAELTGRSRTVDQAIVAGGGEGVNRVYFRVGTTSGVRRRVTLLDQRQSVDLAEITQAGEEALIEGEGKAGLRLTPVEQPHLRYGIHYRVGDKVAAAVGDQRMIDIVKQVTILHEGSGRPIETPSIGSTDSDDESEQEPLVRNLAKRLARLEREW